MIVLSRSDNEFLVVSRSDTKEQEPEEKNSRNAKITSVLFYLRWIIYHIAINSDKMDSFMGKGKEKRAPPFYRLKVKSEDTKK